MLIKSYKQILGLSKDRPAVHSNHWAHLQEHVGAGERDLWGMELSSWWIQRWSCWVRWLEGYQGSHEPCGPIIQTIWNRETCQLVHKLHSENAHCQWLEVHSWSHHDHITNRWVHRGWWLDRTAGQYSCWEKKPCQSKSQILHLPCTGTACWWSVTIFPRESSWEILPDSHSLFEWSCSKSRCSCLGLTDQLPRVCQCWYSWPILWLVASSLLVSSRQGNCLC